MIIIFLLLYTGMVCATEAPKGILKPVTSAELRTATRGPLTSAVAASPVEEAPKSILKNGGSGDSDVGGVVGIDLASGKVTEYEPVPPHSILRRTSPASTRSQRALEERCKRHALESVQFGSWHLQQVSDSLQQARILDCLPAKSVLEQLLAQHAAVGERLKQLVAPASSVAADIGDTKSEGKTSKAKEPIKIEDLLLVRPKQTEIAALDVMRHLSGLLANEMACFSKENHRMTRINETNWGHIQNNVQQIVQDKNFGRRNDSDSDDGEW